MTIGRAVVIGIRVGCAATAHAGRNFIWIGRTEIVAVERGIAVGVCVGDAAPAHAGRGFARVERTLIGAIRRAVAIAIGECARAGAARVTAIARRTRIAIVTREAGRLKCTRCGVTALSSFAIFAGIHDAVAAAIRGGAERDVGAARASSIAIRALDGQRAGKIRCPGRNCSKRDSQLAARAAGQRLSGGAGRGRATHKREMRAADREGNAIHIAGASVAERHRLRARRGPNRHTGKRETRRRD